MKRQSVFLFVVLFVFGLVNVGQSELHLRGQGTSVHGTFNLIYDDDLDITWYDYSQVGDHWEIQMAWADALSVDFGGNTYNDWRLPATVDGPYVFGYDGTTTAGYNITNRGELCHLFYIELENLAFFNTSGERQPGWGLNNTGDFQNLNTVIYWSETEYAANTNQAWQASFHGGSQAIDLKGTHYSALVVRDGDVEHIPIPSTISYTGDLSEQYSDQADLSAILVDEDSGVGISGQTIVFTIGSQSATATTLTDGSCSASLTMNQVPGSYTVTASYAGNAIYLPSSDAEPFEVLKEDTILTFTGDLSEPMLYPADLSANLLDADTGLVVGDVDRGIEGCTINFSIGSQSVSTTTSADGSCSASLTINQVPGPYTVTASYAGNANYQASSDSDTFQITDPLITTPSEHDFGDVVIGTSSTVIVSIEGNGVTPTISNISIIGSPDFSITTMPSLPATVPLDLEIAYTPTVEGYNSALLSISATSIHTTSTITYDVPLDGVGVYTEALIDILDDTLTPKTKWIKCQIWPPDGYSYADIDIETFLLEWQIPVSRYSFNEKKQKLVVMFPASGLNLVPSPDPLELTVSGELFGGTLFEGSDFVTVVEKGGKKK